MFTISEIALIREAVDKLYEELLAGGEKEEDISSCESVIDKLREMHIRADSEVNG